jgi:sugar phosphate isomerase/epimerase
LLTGLACALFSLSCQPAVSLGQTPAKHDVFSKSNLVAWCIVPFDDQKRGPVARAEMLQDLGITREAFDWRAEQIPTFDAEVDALRSHNIELTAVWMVAGDDPAHDRNVQVVLDLLRRKNVHTQIWVMYTPANDAASLTQDQKVAREAKTISYLASEAAKTGSSVALYNHNGWPGEPENQLAVLDLVKAANVGIVYNFNHAQDQIERFPQFFPRILPHLLALNIAGLRQGQQKIYPVGRGDSEQKMIALVWKSGYHGPIGIINENTAPDAKRGLQMNLFGLQQILAEIGDESALATYR